eukprot:10705458-Heterocapsa_arctica.AAC.1
MRADRSSSGESNGRRRQVESYHGVRGHRQPRHVGRRRELGQFLDGGRKPVLFDEKRMSAARDALESATV